jgi:Tol biopolymer transport system component
MTLEDMEKMLRVAGPQVSPDGRWIAYTVSRVDTVDDKDISNLWMVSWDGKDDIQLTYSKDSVGSPRWSPDGRWLAFTSSREGESKGVAGLATGPARRRGASTYQREGGSRGLSLVPGQQTTPAHADRQG